MKVRIHIQRLKEAHVLFLVIGGILGLLYTLAVPPLWGFDETSHFARVYQISEGHILLNKSKNDFGGNMPKSFNVVSRYATADIGEAKDPDPFTRKDVNNYGQYKQLLSQKFSKDSEQAINPAGYSPFAYPLSEVTTFAARLINLNIGHTLLMARIGGLISYIALGYLGLRFVRTLKAKWLIFAIGLSPVMIAQAATLSADTLTNGLSLLFMSALILIFVKPKEVMPIHKYALYATAIWMPLVKINYIFLSVGILLIPITVFANRNKQLIYKMSAFAIAVIAGVIWTLLMSVTSTSGVSPRPDGLPVNPSAQMHFLVLHPFSFLWAICKSFIYYGDAYIHEMFGVIGWNYVVLPILFVLIAIVMILVAGYYAKDELVKLKRPAVILTLSAVIGLSTIFAALYMGFTPVGKSMVDGVQGRYFLPFLLPIVIYLVNLLPVRLSFDKASRAVVIFGGSASTVLLLSLAYYIALTY